MINGDKEHAALLTPGSETDSEKGEDSSVDLKDIVKRRLHNWVGCIYDFMVASAYISALTLTAMVNEV